MRGHHGQARVSRGDRVELERTRSAFASGMNPTEAQAWAGGWVTGAGATGWLNARR